MICEHKSTKLNSSKFTDNPIEHQIFIYTQLKIKKLIHFHLIFRPAIHFSNI